MTNLNIYADKYIEWLNTYSRDFGSDFADTCPDLSSKEACLSGLKISLENVPKQDLDFRSIMTLFEVTLKALMSFLTAPFIIFAFGFLLIKEKLENKRSLNYVKPSFSFKKAIQALFENITCTLFAPLILPCFIVFKYTKRRKTSMLRVLKAKAAAKRLDEKPTSVPFPIVMRYLKITCCMSSACSSNNHISIENVRDIAKIWLKSDGLTSQGFWSTTETSSNGIHHKKGGDLITFMKGLETKARHKMFWQEKGKSRERKDFMAWADFCILTEINAGEWGAYLYPDGEPKENEPLDKKQAFLAGAGVAWNFESNFRSDETAPKLPSLLQWSVFSASFLDGVEKTLSDIIWRDERWDEVLSMAKASLEFKDLNSSCLQTEEKKSRRRL